MSILSSATRAGSASSGAATIASGRSTNKDASRRRGSPPRCASSASTGSARRPLRPLPANGGAARAALGREIEERDDLAEGVGRNAPLALAFELGEHTAVLCTHGDVIFNLLGEETNKGSTCVLETVDGRLSRRDYLSPRLTRSTRPPPGRTTGAPAPPPPRPGRAGDPRRATCPRGQPLTVRMRDGPRPVRCALLRPSRHGRAECAPRIPRSD